MKSLLIILFLFTVAVCQEVGQLCSIREKFDSTDSVLAIHTDAIRTLQKFVLLLAANQIQRKDIANLDSLLKEIRAPKENGGSPAN